MLSLVTSQTLAGQKCATPSPPNLILSSLPFSLSFAARSAHTLCALICSVLPFTSCSAPLPAQLPQVCFGSWKHTLGSLACGQAALQAHGVADRVVSADALSRHLWAFPDRFEQCNALLQLLALISRADRPCACDSYVQQKQQQRTSDCCRIGASTAAVAAERCRNSHWV
jgi:hypothetical protein